MQSNNVADDDAKITLAQAAALCPRRPSISTLWRWCRRGVSGRNGRRVYLAHERLGATLFTSRGALADFARELTMADNDYFRQNPPPPCVLPPKPSKHRTEEQRQAAVRRATSRLSH